MPPAPPMRRPLRRNRHAKLKRVEEEVLGKAYDSRLMRRLLGYMRPYRGYVALSLVFLLLQSVLQVLGPLLTKIAVDRYLAPNPARVPTPIDSYLPAGPWNGLAAVGMLYLGVLLGTFIFEFAQVYLMQYTGQLAMFDLRKQLMAHLQGLDLAFFDRNPVGRLVTRVTTDVDVLNDLFASGLVTILGDVLVLGFIVAIMFKLSPGLTGLMLGVMPLVILVTAVFRRSVTQSYRRIRIAIAKINAYLQEHVTGIVVLQLFNREARSRQEFDGVNREHMEAYKDAILAYGWFYPVVEFLSMLALAGHPGLWRLSRRARRADAGRGGGLPAIRLRFFRPIQDLSEKYNILQGAMASAERIFKLLDTQAAILPPAQPQPRAGLARASNSISVWFAYKDEDWVLRDVSFVDRARRNHRGGGPHRRRQNHPDQPAAALLRRAEGRHPHRRRRHPRTRSARAAPPVRRGLAGSVSCSPARSRTTSGWAREGIGREAVEAAAEQVNLLDFIQSLPDGFEHSIRERGSGLSTGQKQLISFARALAHNPRFLILDEATSSVDTGNRIPRARGA